MKVFRALQNRGVIEDWLEKSRKVDEQEFNSFCKFFRETKARIDP